MSSNSLASRGVEGSAMRASMCAVRSSRPVMGMSLSMVSVDRSRRVACFRKPRCSSSVWSGCSREVGDGSEGGEDDGKQQQRCPVEEGQRRFSDLQQRALGKLLVDTVEQWGEEAKT